MFINQDGGAVGRREAVSDSNTKSIQSAVGCVERPDGKPLPPPGPAWEQELFARHGRPFMFPVRGGVAFGVSSAPDNSSSLYLWADNQTGEAVTLYFCCISTLFDHIEIFDSEGHRVLGKSDQVAQKALSEPRDLVQVCSCSGSHPYQRTQSNCSFPLICLRGTRFNGVATSSLNGTHRRRTTDIRRERIHASSPAWISYFDTVDGDSFSIRASCCISTG